MPTPPILCRCMAQELGGHLLRCGVRAWLAMHRKGPGLHEFSGKKWLILMTPHPCARVLTDLCRKSRCRTGIREAVSWYWCSSQSTNHQCSWIVNLRMTPSDSNQVEGKHSLDIRNDCAGENTVTFSHAGICQEGCRLSGGWA